MYYFIVYPLWLNPLLYNLYLLYVCFIVLYTVVEGVYYVVIFQTHKMSYQITHNVI